LTYYLYTDKVLFSTGPASENLLDLLACEVEDLFAIAHCFDLPDLRRRAFDFLVETCNKTNILSRFGGSLAAMYPEIDDAYQESFRKL
jgi:hypothetical protein